MKKKQLDMKGKEVEEEGSQEVVVVGEEAREVGSVKVD